MSNTGLLRKAREILAYTKQPSSPEMRAEVRKAEPVCPRAKTHIPVSLSISTPVIQDTQIESATPNARLVYWETGNGRILGPATPEFLAKSGNQFWIVTTFKGQIRWINADMLRSRNTFETQRAVREVELVRF